MREAREQTNNVDWAAFRGHEAVVSYLKRAADPNMLEVSLIPRLLCGGGGKRAW